MFQVTENEIKKSREQKDNQKYCVNFDVILFS